MYVLLTLVLLNKALDVESALDLGIGPGSGNNPGSESNIFICVKVKRYSFRKSDSAIFIVASLLSEGQLFAPPQKMLFLRADPILKGLCLPDKKSQ